MDYERVLRESTGLVTCLAMGLVNFKMMEKPWKILFFQAFLYLVTLVLAYYVTHYKVSMNNHRVYNLYMPLDTLLPCLAARHFVPRPYFKIVTAFLFLCFSATYAFAICRHGLDIFANYACVASNLCLLVVYGFLLYSLLHIAGDPLRTAKIWLCIGILVCSACMIPFMSLIHYLNRLDLRLSDLLFTIIDLSGNVRYFCLAIAFWLIGRNTAPTAKHLS